MASHLLQDTRPTSPTPEERTAAAWSRFVDAENAADFHQSWFTLLCAELDAVRCGALLLHTEESNSFSPVAVWPDVAQDMSYLNAVIERALSEQRGVAIPADTARGPELHIAYPTYRESRIAGVVVLVARQRSNDETQLLMRRLHWGLGWLQQALTATGSAALQQRIGNIGALCEAVASSVREAPLQQCLYDAANQIARHLDCSRAAIGLERHARVQVCAFSDSTGLEKNTDSSSLYQAAMTEALDSQTIVRFDAETQLASPSAHAELAHAFGAKHIVSIPLQLGIRCIGVVTVERHSTNAFDPVQLEWLQALATLLAGVIDQKQLAEEGYLGRLARDLKKLAGAIVGPRHLLWKFAGLAAVAVFAALMWVRMDYQVRAKTVIEGQVQRTAAAPYQGFVAASFARAGDIVRRGQLLCVMDDRELRLERDKWASEREQHLRELREAMAEHDLTRIQIVDAQVRQSEAQLALVNDQLTRSRIVAPFDGVVISGDLSQLIGSPVELGKRLFEIAPLHDYRVILQVDESEIRHIHEQQPGRLLVAGIASDPLTFVVSKITPVSTAKDGANYFRVEAALDEAPENLRPGMEGIGKIAVGERRLWWIVTHSFTDWVTLKLWQWAP